MRALLALALALVALPARAQIEHLAQIEPGRDELQAEIYKIPRSTTFELIAGVGERFALGGEIELEHGEIEELAAIGIVRFADPQRRPIGVGMMAELGFDPHGMLRKAELRAIVERRRRDWWLQVDAILRHSRHHGRHDTGASYALSAQRDTFGIWFGIEASGRLAELESGGSEPPPGPGRAGATRSPSREHHDDDDAHGPRGDGPPVDHYAGPSLTLSQSIGEIEIEIGLAWLFRLYGHGPERVPRSFLQLTF